MLGEVEKMKYVTAKPINTLRTVVYGLALAACIGGFASIAASAPTKAQDVKADVVYRNGFVYTVDSVRSRAQAFAVKDGKFIAVGSNEDMKAVTGKDTKVVNLKGKMVMPGLIDTHIHALRGALTALGLAFPVTASVDDIKAAVKKYIADKKLKKGDWIEGAKWSIDYHKLNAKMLDDVAPDNPVFLHDWTNHLAWVNSAALKAAKITKDTPDPQGGVIDRDSSDNPTGTLHDKALGLIAAAMPPPAPKTVEERATWIFNKLNGYGITGIVTAQLDPVRLKAYRDLESKDKLTVRIQGSWDFNTRYVTTTLEEQSKTFMTRDKRGQNSPLINVDGVKADLRHPEHRRVDVQHLDAAFRCGGAQGHGARHRQPVGPSLPQRRGGDATRQRQGANSPHGPLDAHLPGRGGPVQLRALELHHRGVAVPALDPGSRHPPMDQVDRSRPLRPDLHPAQDHHRRGRRGDLRQ
jgi:hypothetical protein